MFGLKPQMSEKHLNGIVDYTGTAQKQPDMFEQYYKREKTSFINKYILGCQGDSDYNISYIISSQPNSQVLGQTTK